MKELRELINDPVVSAFLDILPHHDTVAVICTGLGERRFTTNQLAPLIAMHNALPELLNAWEMVQAVIEFTDVHRGDVVEVTQDVGYSWCISDLNKILKPYSGRDAHADTTAD